MMPPASCSVPPAFNSFEPAAPASGNLSKTSTRAESQPGLTSVSLLRKSRYLPRALAAAWLQFGRKPESPVFLETRTPGMEPSRLLNASSERSSPMMTSYSTSVVFVRMHPRQRTDVEYEVIIGDDRSEEAFSN